MTEIVRHATDQDLIVSPSMPEETAITVRERASMPYSSASETAILAALDKGWAYGLDAPKVDQDEVLKITRAICVAERVREVLEMRGMTIDDVTPAEARALTRDTNPVGLDFNIVHSTVDHSARAAMRHVIAVRRHNAAIANECATHEVTASESDAVAL